MTWNKREMTVGTFSDGILAIVIGSLSNHDDDGNKTPINKFAYLTMKNSIFASLQVHFSFFDILKTFSFFLRREMTCFAVVWTT